MNSGQHGFNDHYPAPRAESKLGGSKGLRLLGSIIFIRFVQFNAGDTVDRALCAALVHEMTRCKEAFSRFEHLGGRLIVGDTRPALPRHVHDAYADFLRHLYEFYLGAFKRDRWSTADIHWKAADALFNSEAEKMLRRRRDAIVGGYAPEWENQLRVYQVPVPSEFGSQLRHIRNANSHADPRRARPTNNWPLDRFYRECHLFVYLLFYSAHASWGCHSVERTGGSMQQFRFS